MRKIKLLMINIILLLLLNILPKEKIPEVVSTVEKIPEKIAIIYDEDITQVSSRSLSRDREKMEYVRPTIYSEDLYKYIKAKESFKPEAYLLEGEQYYTIGYGHHGEDVSAGQVISEEQADRLLRADLKGTSDYVLKHCDYFDITQNQLDALTSFAYNGGPGMLQQLTANKTRSAEEISQHIEFYTKSSSEKYRNGLKNRRLEEKEIYLGGFENEETQIEY